MRAGMKGLPRRIQALLITQMLFNIGFYLVVPFIAVEMTDSLGASGAVVGLVLGVRTFSQQGMFFLGGGLADRFGAIRVLLVGVAIRVLGFLVAGSATSVEMMLVGVILIGFAAALFSPAVESLLASGGHELEERGVCTRAHLFALDASYSRIGSLTGPLLGALLIPVGFSLVCHVGAAIFAGIFVMHLLLVPRWRGVRSTSSGSMTSAWGRILCNRGFMVFALFYSTYLLAYNQQYLALPVELRRATGSDEYLSWYFAIAAVFVIGLQTTMTAWAQRLAPSVAIGGGFALMALSFAVVAVCAPIEMSGWWALAPSMVMLLVMHTGMMIAVPISKDLVGTLTGNRDLGSAYGFLNSFGGLAVLLGSLGIGATLDWAEIPQPAAAVPWIITTVLLLISAVGLTKLRHGAGQEK